MHAKGSEKRLIFKNTCRAARPPQGKGHDVDDGEGCKDEPF